MRARGCPQRGSPSAIMRPNRTQKMRRLGHYGNRSPKAPERVRAEDVIHMRKLFPDTLRRALFLGHEPQTAMICAGLALFECVNAPTFPSAASPA